MRHLKKGRTFGRTRDQRRALLRTLAAQLIARNKLVTTEAKAKELRPLVEKLITRAKRGTLHDRRIIGAAVPDRTAVQLIREIAPRFRERAGGYARITKLGPRQSDASRMAIIELVQ